MKIKSPPTIIIVRVALLGLLGVACSSCTSSQDVDYKSYVKLPCKAGSIAMRSVLKSVPYTKKNAFYGNYGGLGDSGGMPIDEMDEHFRRHDVAYIMAKSIRTMRLADEELVKALKRIDDESLTEYGREYRDRAIKFMESPAAGLIGKPLTALFRRNEPSGSYFSDPDSVRWFFKSSHSGFPDSDEAGMQRLSIKDGTEGVVSTRFAALKN